MFNSQAVRTWKLPVLLGELQKMPFWQKSSDLSLPEMSCTLLSYLTIFSWNFLHLCQFLPNVADRNTNSDFKFTREFTSVASTNKVIGTEIHFYYFQVRRAKYTNSLRRSLSQKLIWYQIHTDHKPVNSWIISECSFHKNKMAFYLTFSFAVSHREKHQFNCRLAY